MYPRVPISRVHRVPSRFRGADATKEHSVKHVYRAAVARDTTSWSAMPPAIEVIELYIAGQQKQMAPTSTTWDSAVLNNGVFACSVAASQRAIVAILFHCLNETK